MRIRNTAFFQMAWVVRDLDAAMQRWREVHGVGPFSYMKNITMTPENFTYRGRATTVTYSAALAQTSGMQIELVQQIDDEPSAYREPSSSEGEGVHHMGMMVDNFEDVISEYCSQGFEIAQRGSSLGVDFCYLDMRPVFGRMVEVLRESAQARTFQKFIADTAAGWDGKDPYRPIPIGQENGIHRASAGDSAP